MDYLLYDLRIFEIICRVFVRFFEIFNAFLSILLHGSRACDPTHDPGPSCRGRPGGDPADGGSSRP